MNPIVLEDPEIGKIIFYYNPRAKKYIIRIKQDMVKITIPQRGTYAFAEKFFRENREVVKRKMTTYCMTEQETKPRISDVALKKQALEILPTTLDRLAKIHGFSYNGVTIRKSKTRWGSCSSKANINLSFYMMLLPQHLIEYVLLHELCHTVEMNHSPAFWRLLDQHTKGNAKTLRKKLRQYATSIF